MLHQAAREAWRCSSARVVVTCQRHSGRSVGMARRFSSRVILRKLVSEAGSADPFDDRQKPASKLVGSRLVLASAVYACGTEAHAVALLLRQCLTGAQADAARLVLGDGLPRCER